MKNKFVLGIFFFLILMTSSVFASMVENSRQGSPAISAEMHPESTPQKPGTLLGFELRFLGFCIRSGIRWTDPSGLILWPTDPAEQARLEKLFQENRNSAEQEKLKRVKEKVEALNRYFQEHPEELEELGRQSYEETMNFVMGISLECPRPGRAGKQARLKDLLQDPNLSSADRGWIQQELNAIERGERTTIRVPPGKNLAHRRGSPAKEGFGYEFSDLQDIIIHKIQHFFEGY